LEAITAQARQAGGNATIFIAAPHGQTPGNGIFDLQDPVLQGLQQRLSQAFDPQGVFSAGQGA
jgi:glycolate oxidase FAD binding subunit